MGALPQGYPSYFRVPPGSLKAFDLSAGQGTNSYSLKISNGDDRMKVHLWNVRLVAFEL
jgi:hypothetical protein